MNDYITFNKMILFTVEAYLSAADNQGQTKEQMHKDLISGIRGYMTFCKFSPSQRQQLTDLENDAKLNALKKQEISFIVYAMELIKLWLENVPIQHRKHIHLGVSNKKLRAGRAYFALLMLQQKQLDKNEYDKKKEIIDVSVITAKHFFSYMKERLV